VRVDQTNNLKADDNATAHRGQPEAHRGRGWHHALGAIVLMTDGGDNTGGVDRETIAQLKQLRVPVHTIVSGPIISPKTLKWKTLPSLQERWQTRV